jgi:hypothetical protein
MRHSVEMSERSDFNSTAEKDSFPGIRKEGLNVAAGSASIQSSLMALSPTVFLGRYFWAKISFEKNARGKVTRFIWSNGQNYSAEKIR